MKIDLYQVDAFTGQVFGGNPAAVCPLTAWPSDFLLQSIAAENNLAETAFFVPQGSRFELRWFTPAAEIDLCGHATLATAHVIFRHLHYPRDEVHFQTRFAGSLSARRDGDWITLDLPSWAAKAAEIPEAAVVGLNGMRPQECYLRRDYMFVYSTEEEIRTVQPDYSQLMKLGRDLCITAPGRDCDFVSRFFNAADESGEDPVTGSAHSMLIPYWAKRLGKSALMAKQLSKRQGELKCQLLGERVLLSGQAQTYMCGQIQLPD